MTGNDLATQRLDARYREAHAALDAFTSSAKARNAATALSELSVLRKQGKRVKQRLADIKLHVTPRADDDRRDIEVAIHNLEAGIERFRERYVTQAPAPVLT